LYFANAPSVDFQKETIESPKLFTADLLRADKAMMAHGVETRVPFLDKEFLDIAVQLKQKKKCLRRIMVKKNTFCEKLLIFRKILSSRRSFMEAKNNFRMVLGIMD
jgi:asparagine synthetase B (glutamine-hydrolysing)